MPIHWPGPDVMGVCERCRRTMYRWPPNRLAPADIDEDICETCGEEVIKACTKYHNTKKHCPISPASGVQDSGG